MRSKKKLSFRTAFFSLISKKLVNQFNRIHRSN